MGWTWKDVERGSDELKEVVFIITKGERYSKEDEEDERLLEEVRES